ncbi:fimbrial protein [Superficieibacter electus]|uniref:Fimbrial protein n=1 Tax=Superficieibacter electus TaxID=2022662 RepID=A0A2P5GMH4_9ENTR|nr:fimbrial protein [Superficieibacter electus]POP41590.1 fimbrial protein [Superficieibacter electus]POP47019.1 fimbrial protein [Superficieibacter electus]
MKRNKRLFFASALMIAFPLASQAEDLNVDFTANVLATTCSMSIASLDGSTVTGNAASGYTLSFGDVGMDKIALKSAESEKNFKFVANECSASLTNISTKLASSQSASGNYIKNESTATDAATNVGMGFKRKSTSGDTWLTPGSGQIDWTQAERDASTVEMTVALRELTDGAGTMGAFSAKATFDFTYQ